jgi:hypothetical protein
MLVKPLVRSIVRSIAGRPTNSLGSGFAPSTLFSAGEQGYVYDLNDLSTLFTDSALTTPATVNGLVGGVVDKSGRGNNATQATTGNKPVLRGSPIGANFFTNGDGSTTTGWTTDGASTLASVGGRLRLTKAAAAFGHAYKNFTTVIGNVYLIKWKAYTGTAGPYFSCGDGTGAGKAYVTNRTTDGNAYFTATGTTSGVFIQVNDATASLTYAEFDDIEIFNVSAGQVQAPYALQFDGVDDFLQTASVNFTATDKMTVCHGVRKLSDDIAFGMVCETSADLNANNGGFYMVAPNVGSTPSFGFVSKGTIQSGAAANPGYPAPFLGVVCGLGNISGDSSIIRVNGVQAGTSATDQGTGNYGNYAIYFGRRGGASLPYNGLMFSAICVGKAVSATELANIERWTNQRTNAY